MELQIHPASGRGTVRTLAVHAAGERVIVALVGAAALATLSLWVTAPAMLRRWLREQDVPRLARETAEAQVARAEVLRQAELLKARSLDSGDLLNRIAFLYEVSPSPPARSPAPADARASSRDSSNSKPTLLQLLLYAAAAAQLRDEHAALVADGLRRRRAGS